MKSKKYDVNRFLISLCILSFVSLCFASTALGAGKRYMEDVQKLSWDLKANKKIKLHTTFAGIGTAKRTVKISEYELTEQENGNRKVDLTITFKTKWKPSSEEIHMISQSDYFLETGKVGGGVYVTVVDYYTGMCLEGANDSGVSVTWNSGYEVTREKSYVDADGCVITLTNEKVSLTIEYPSSYKGLCLGVGGLTRCGDAKEGEKNYFEGRTPFGNTTMLYSAEDEMVAHFMRITN